MNPEVWIIRLQGSSCFMTVRKHFACAIVYCQENNKALPAGQGSLLVESNNRRLLNAALFDASFLTGEVTQVVKFSTAHFTVFVNGD